MTHLEKRRLCIRLMGMTSLSPWMAGCSYIPDTFKRPEDFANVLDFEVPACEGLSGEACDFMNGGSDDRATLNANRTGYSKYQLIPRVLVDVSTLSTELTLFGTKLRSPVFLSPIGLNKVFHASAEAAVARAAAAAGHMMIASHMTSLPFEEIVAAYGAPVWFQMYLTDDQGFNREMVQRVESTGCRALFVTVDSPVAGNREGHLRYLQELAKTGTLVFGNFKQGMRKTVNPATKWSDLEWLKSITNMAVVPKGIVSAEDAQKAVAMGLDGLMVSNHGGRQLNSNRSTIEALGELVDVTGGSVPVLLDGGVRRGTDLVKALAIGARAVGVGRPYIWGLRLFGQDGVARILNLLQEDLTRNMQLLGATGLETLNRGMIRATQS